MIILWNNLIQNATLTASTKKTYYEPEQLLDERLITQWSPITATDEWVMFDFGSATAISAFALGGHNVTETGTVRVEGHTSSDFTSPSFSLEITGSSVFKTFEEQTYRYWRVYFYDFNNPWLKVGRIYLGPYLTLPPIDPNTRIDTTTSAISQRSVTGQVYGSEGVELKSLSVDYPLIYDNERKQIEEMFQTASTVHPVFIAIWEDSLDVEPVWYAVITNQTLSMQKDDTGLYWSSQMTFQEAR